MTRSLLHSRTTAERSEEVHPPYRADIDGLRGIAVIAVVVFHLFPSALPGGFVGVDVFFVISGYLISQIIMMGLERKDFGFLAFYARRARRLYPALIVVLAASLAFGWTALSTGEYEQLGTHAAAGAAFVSNFVLWSESGYFDNAALTKPLLHLWSLGVEEQFYIVWPLFLWFAWKARSSFLLVAASLGALSFAANLIATPQAPEAAFYSPFTRFWELMLGAMLAHLAVRRATTAQHPPGGSAFVTDARFAGVASLLGAALIALSFVFMREADFPGVQALVPALGASLLIVAGPHAPVNRAVLSCGALVAVGLVSYPLYLWHWPLLSFSRIVHGELPLGMRAAILVASVALAVLTYRLLERPLKSAGQRNQVALALAVVLTAVGGAGLAVAMQGGIQDRPVVLANAPLEQSRASPPVPFAAPCPRQPFTHRNLYQCYVDVREPPRFALVGDSKAKALFRGLFRTSAPGGTWMVTTSLTWPLLPVISDHPIYAYVNPAAVDMALRLVEGTPSVETVVVATATRALFNLRTVTTIADLPESRNYEAALAGLDASVSRLVAAGKKVVLLVDNPTLPNMEDCVARQTSVALFNVLLANAPQDGCRISIARHLELSRRYRDLLAEIRDRHPGQVSVFDTVPILCDERAGFCTPMHDGRLLYGVTDHISSYGAHLVGSALNRELQPRGTPFPASLDR